jgi:UDP-glucose 4-epimerase
MVSQTVWDEDGDAAIWLDESSGPQLGAEGLCRVYAAEHGIACVVLRAARFFPEEDDTHRTLSAFC